jgi:hypothetical protein
VVDSIPSDAFCSILCESLVVQNQNRSLWAKNNMFWKDRDVISIIADIKIIFYKITENYV